MKNLKELDKELKKIIAASYQVGWSDGSVQDMKKARMSTEEIIDYLDSLINQEQNA